jgi:6-bladed beta-propeller
MSARNVALCGLVVFGCGSAGSASLATRADSAGIEIVSNTPEDRQLMWVFEKVLTLGGEDAGPESFYQVPPHGLAFDQAGQIYVLDAGNKRIQVFDEAGSHVRTIGREGRGPGEFQFPASFTIEGTGVMAVHDFGKRAILRFDSTGEFLDQRPAPRGIFGPIRAAGPVYYYATQGMDSATGGNFFRLRRATATDTAEVAAVQLPASKSINYESCGIVISLLPLLANPPSWDTRVDRLALAGVADYTVRIFEADIEVRQVHRRLEPQAATPELVTRELGDGEAWTIGGGRTCTVPSEEVIEKRGIAERIPLINKVAVTPDGGLWVQREVMGEDVGPVDVFDATGEYVGTLPAESPWPVDFGPSNRILVLEKDELDVPRVAVYRIREG